MRPITSFAIVAALLASACATTTPAGTETVDNTFKLDGSVWGNGQYRFLVAMKAVESNGFVAVCAVTAIELDGTYLFDTEIENASMSAGRITLDGKTVVNGLRKFPGPDREGQLAGREAVCLQTIAAWSDQYEDQKALEYVSPRRVSL